MLHMKLEKKCKTSHLFSKNEIFFVFIKISTSVKIIGYLQRYGLMFKTSLQLSLTSFSSIPLSIKKKNSNGYYMYLASFREKEQYYTNIEPRWQTKPNTVLPERIQLISLITHVLFVIVQSQRMCSCTLLYITFFTVHYRILPNHVWH